MTVSPSERKLIQSLLTKPGVGEARSMVDIYIYVYYYYIYICIYYIWLLSATEHYLLNLLLKIMVEWSVSLWNWLSIAGEVNRLIACPFHCGTSCTPWFLLGVTCGFALCLLAFGLLTCLWIFRSEFLPRVPVVVPGPTSKTRLAKYLE